MKSRINRLLIAASIAMSCNPGALAGNPETGQALQADATVVSGIDTSGTVRVCNLANLEALLNLFGSGCEVAGILIGCFLLVKSLTRAQETRRKRANRALIATLVMVAGILTPAAINLCVATARDANLFS